jgi:hypothetical protein
MTKYMNILTAPELTVEIENKCLRLRTMEIQNGKLEIVLAIWGPNEQLQEIYDNLPNNN